MCCVLIECNEKLCTFVQTLTEISMKLKGCILSLQDDMREFLNTPSVMNRPGIAGTGSIDLEPPPTPLGGRSVSEFF